MKTLLDLYFAYVAQFIYNRATYMIMINSLQIYEFVCMYNARFLLYRNNTGTIHTYMYNLQIVIYRDTSPLHGHLVTKYLQIFKIQGFGYFQEDDIQLPGFYTNIPPSRRGVIRSFTRKLWHFYRVRDLPAAPPVWPRNRYCNRHLASQ